MVHEAKGAGSQTVNVLKEMTNRALGLPDLALYGLRIRPYKKLRLRVVILRDEAGRPLATEADVLPSIAETRRILATVARTAVIPAEPLVVTLPDPAPMAALNVHCDDGAWQEDFKLAGAYFRKWSARNWHGTLLGFAAPVTVFIVRDISLKGGCSLGPLADYVTLEARMLNRARHRIMCHEIAHACGLFHTKDKPNLMFPTGPGDQLAGWQIALLRNSRHVTYL